MIHAKLQLNAFPTNSPILFTALIAKDNIMIIIVTERIKPIIPKAKPIKPQIFFPIEMPPWRNPEKPVQIAMIPRIMATKGTKFKTPIAKMPNTRDVIVLLFFLTKGMGATYPIGGAVTTSREKGA